METHEFKDCTAVVTPWIEDPRENDVVVQDVWGRTAWRGALKSNGELPSFLDALKEHGIRAALDDSIWEDT